MPELRCVALGLLISVSASPALSADTIDLPRLLDRNGCLGCHGTNYKIMGPGYDQVARRYRGQADALQKVEASIAGGSQGKWGGAPMPAFHALSAQEVQALAEFVLKQ